MTFKYFNVKNGLSTGNIYLHAGNSNVVASTFIGNLKVTDSANLGNAAVANFFIGDGGLLSNISVNSSNIANLANLANSANIANLANLANSANLAELANIANIVSSSSQPNITSLGNLTTLTVEGPVYLGDVSNVHIGGGSNGYILQTDGTGNLSWVINSGSGQLQLPDVAIDSFTADGSNNNFQLSVTPDSKDYLIINVDGVLQLNDSYTLTGDAVQFGSMPDANSLIEIRTLIPGQASGGSSSSANTIVNGNSNVKVYANSDVTISSNGTANIVKVSTTDITISANLVPNANVTYDLGSPNNAFRDLYLSGSTIYFGGATIKADAVTGAIALIPQPTANTPNPTGLVISTSGTISTVVTNAGNISNADFSNVVANTPSYASTTYVDNAISNVTATIKPQAKTYYWKGTLAENVSNMRYYIPVASTLTAINTNLGANGSTQSTLIVKKNGSTINTITIPANTSTVNQTVNVAISTNDYLTVDITQASTASDAYVTFVYS